METKKQISISDILSGNKIKKIIIIFGIVGIGLIFLSTFTNFNFANQDKKDITYSSSEYCSQMQTEITNMVQSIEGVGEAKVLLTMENSSEAVYLQNGSTKTKEIEPVIRGVVVVCDGGNNSVTKALNISKAKVCVTKLSK